VVKASSRDDVLPQLFHAALAEIDVELADAVAIVVFGRGVEHLQATLVSRADVVSAYGSDATLNAIRERLSATTTFVPHGNGLGVGYVARSAIDDEAHARECAAAFALDVAAYDQRGCFSPHAIWVERGGRIDALSWAHMLAEALHRRSVELPRGALPTEAGAAQIQWRGVAAARGELIEGDGFAVSYEAGASLRIAPGYRNVLVLDAASREAFAQGLRPLGMHLKCVGVAGTPDGRRSLARALPPPIAARVCAAGDMQRPSLLDFADGRAPWEGLVRTTQIG
jgi:hypothetical protein